MQYSVSEKIIPDIKMIFFLKQYILGNLFDRVTIKMIISISEET